MQITRQRDGLVQLDPEELELRRRRAGMSKTQLALRAGVSRNTVITATHGDGIHASSAKAIADALGVDVERLRKCTDRDSVANSRAFAVPNTEEWDVAGYLGGWTEASNGLQYRVCRMQHRFTAGRLGRGKFYDLLGVRGRDHATLRDHLSRHAVICNRVGLYPHIAENESSVPTLRDEGWWVIDRWIDGAMLSERFAHGPWPEKQLARLMSEIARGLEALHAAQVAFRELSPAHVLMADDGRAVLTDFELGKLLDGAVTVSSDWPDDPYRAPEVDSGKADAQADLFSWARILVHAATGTLPPIEQADDAVDLEHVSLPKSVRRIAQDCLSRIASDRPKDIHVLLRAVRGWSEPTERRGRR